jgi:transaldolase
MYGDGRGLEVDRALTQKKIRTNMTAMMTFNQLVLAAKAGATYVSLFYNRAIEVQENPLQIIRDYVGLAKDNPSMGRLIVGSIRKPEDVAQAMAAGAHIMTIPSKILKQMPYNKRTEETIQEFDRAWEEFLGVKRAEVVSVKTHGSTSAPRSV